MSSTGLPDRSGVGAPLPNPTGQSPRAAVTISNARAEASRRNGARSRGPKTPAGKARASQNALKHGLRAASHLVLPAEDPAAFAVLEAALFEELAPVGAVQIVLACQIVAAAWRLGRVERMEAELLVFRDRGECDLGLAATRDANTARALPTLVRYRAAAHAELLRSLRALEALRAAAAKTERAQAERVKTGAAPGARTAAKRTAARPVKPAARPAVAVRPNEPERAGPQLQCVLPGGAPARALHEAAAPWLPRADAGRTPNQPEHRGRGLDHGRTTPAPAACSASSSSPGTRATDDAGS
jgi:hypothetical protein